ncbi:DUF433 domain-containing protein [Candidatus Entotheonella palauensis]|uniref:DUF433 domain-containing protein n=1 Tax=Candidatus Entotheonella gemina TaxID=1429439 RepID=W4LSZ3_9BACT|nr:DUF433 domain-containing protein [Candidatus Entotheonella palauensis]ETX00557.1 MAG: hypothetical protein ETSY2_38830 [Candidatus Entotheonella gemina]
MKASRIVDQGDGPKIEGTRITVYAILEYLRAGRTRDWIAAMLGLSSNQVQVAIDYLLEHETEVNAEYEKILQRLQQGNPASVRAQLQVNREKVKSRLPAQHSSSP